MDVFGIGLPEIIFILLLVVIVFGPKDLEKTGKTVGRAIFRFLNSETFRNRRQIGTLPNEFLRKAGMDEFRAQVPPKGPILQSPPAPTNPKQADPENRIEPPANGGEKVDR